MNCAAYEAAIHDAVEQRRALRTDPDDRHSQQCKHCAKHWETYQLLAWSIGEWCVSRPTVDLADAVLAVVVAEPQSIHHKRPLRIDRDMSSRDDAESVPNRPAVCPAATMPPATAGIVTERRQSKPRAVLPNAGATATADHRRRAPGHGTLAAALIVMLSIFVAVGTRSHRTASDLLTNEFGRAEAVSIAQTGEKPTQAAPALDHPAQDSDVRYHLDQSVRDAGRIWIEFAQETVDAAASPDILLVLNQSNRGIDGNDNDEVPDRLATLSRGLAPVGSSVGRALFSLMDVLPAVESSRL